MADKRDTHEVIEANVLLELLCMNDHMSVEVLDANSDDVLDAVERHANQIALGPTISLRTADMAILLRFDVIGSTDSEIYRQVAEVLGAIEGNTDLRFQRHRSEVEVSTSRDGDKVPA